MMADLVAAAQAGDMLVSCVLLIRGDISRRAAAVVWLGAVPTLLSDSRREERREPALNQRRPLRREFTKAVRKSSQ